MTVHHNQIIQAEHKQVVYLYLSITQNDIIYYARFKTNKLVLCLTSMFQSIRLLPKNLWGIISEQNFIIQANIHQS